MQLDTVQVCAADSPDHSGAELQLCHAVLAALSQSEKTQIAAQYLARSMVCAVVGELPAYGNVHSITILEEPPAGSTSCSLLQLPQCLKDLGYPANVSPQELEKKLRRRYTRTPGASGGSGVSGAPGAPGNLLRQDIASGWTDCWRLQEEYYQGKEDAFVHYMNMGVCACFVAWPNAIMRTSSSKFIQNLISFLDETDSLGYRIIGNADGMNYHYLDFLLYSPSVFVGTLERFFQSVPGGNRARIQGFCCSAAASPVDKAYLTRGTLPRYEYTFVPSTKGLSSSQNKGKGKKKKKRK